MQKRFRLDHRHYHHMYDPEMNEMFNLLRQGLISREDFVQARIRDEVRDWLDQYPRGSWEIRHVIDRQNDIMVDSNYWLFTDDDSLSTLFKLTWM